MTHHPVRSFVGMCFLGSILLGCGPSEVDPPAAAAKPDEAQAHAPDGWTRNEAALLRSLSLTSLPAVASASNRFARDPRAARLGHRLFFETDLSANGEVACASCHKPELYFTDGRPRSLGLAEGNRNAPTLVGAVHSPWMFWDGRRDSLWAQALAPLENAAEMGSSRVDVLRAVASKPELAERYLDIFGALPELDDRARFPEGASPFGQQGRPRWESMAPADREAVDRAFANLGKAIAAYERLLLPGPSPFDRYVDALANFDAAPQTLPDDAIAGLRLFIDMERSRCLQCHNGPMLSNQSFHHVATATSAEGLPEFGRFLGIQSLLLDPFTCLGTHSDAAPEQCLEMNFLNRQEIGDQAGKWKTPTLRGLTLTAPYMHDGRFATLEEVLQHYVDLPPKTEVAHELIPLQLDRNELAQLEAFLRTLTAPVAAAEEWLQPPPASKPVPSSDTGVSSP